MTLYSLANLYASSYYYSFPHFWGFDHVKTNRPISTKLSQDIGSCLKLIIFTINQGFVKHVIVRVSACQHVTHK